MTTLVDKARAGSQRAQLGMRIAATAVHVAREQLPGWNAPTAVPGIPPAAETLTAGWLTSALCADHPGAAVVDLAGGCARDSHCAANGTWRAGLRFARCPRSRSTPD